MFQDKINNTVARVVDSKEIQSNNISGIYNKDDNSFISIKVNEGRNIETNKGKKSIFHSCKKLYEYEELNKVDNNKKLTNVFSLDKSIFVKVKGVTDQQIYDELSRYEKENIVNENMLNDKPNIYVRLFNYENDYNVSELERLIVACDEFGKDKDNTEKIKYVGREGITVEQINNRLAYFDKASELITNLIKDDKLIERFMVIVNIKGIERAYIDDATHKGVTEGAVQFLSRQEQIEKIMSTLITFKDPVIINSKEELEKLQAEYREAHGEKIVHKSEKVEVIRDKKAELLKLMDGQNTRGYIRISHEDYLDAKILIEEMDMPFIAKESGIKVGVNIIVPTEKIQELKRMLIENNNNILQQIEGNIDWNKIKKIQGISGYNVTEKSLKDFQNINNDKFKYIAFENKGKYSIYIEPGCSIKIEGEKMQKNEKNKDDDKKTLKDVAKMKDDYKQSKKVTESKNLEKNNERGER